MDYATKSTLSLTVTENMIVVGAGITHIVMPWEVQWRIRYSWHCSRESRIHCSSENIGLNSLLRPVCIVVSLIPLRTSFPYPSKIELGITLRGVYKPRRQLGEGVTLMSKILNKTSIK